MSTILIVVYMTQKKRIEQRYIAYGVKYKNTLPVLSRGSYAECQEDLCLTGTKNMLQEGFKKQVKQGKSRC